MTNPAPCYRATDPEEHSLETDERGTVFCPWCGYTEGWGSDGYGTGALFDQEALESYR